LWNSLYHITGTDIVRALVFRFEVFFFPLHRQTDDSSVYRLLADPSET
jgi:hypothetical protein